MGVPVRDTVVYRDLKPSNVPRPLRVGDVVRDRHWPTCIDLVTSIDTESIHLDDDHLCFLNLVSFVYEHADGSPISGVLR